LDGQVSIVSILASQEIRLAHAVGVTAYDGYELKRSNCVLNKAQQIGNSGIVPGLRHTKMVSDQRILLYSRDCAAGGNE
jgi:hypothetical protein